MPSETNNGVASSLSGDLIMYVIPNRTLQHSHNNDGNHGVRRDHLKINTYLRPKIIALLPRFFGSHNGCPVICMARKLRLKVKYFSHKTLYIKKSFDTATSGGVSEQLLFSVLGIILTIVRSMVKWGLNLAQVRNTYNHFGAEGIPNNDLQAFFRRCQRLMFFHYTIQVVFATNSMIKDPQICSHMIMQIECNFFELSSHFQLIKVVSYQLTNPPLLSKTRSILKCLELKDRSFNYIRRCPNVRMGLQKGRALEEEENNLLSGCWLV